MTRRNLVTALLFASFVSLIVACGGSNGGVVPGPVTPIKTTPTPTPVPTSSRSELAK
jgi:hypothetical protein